jgi:hypothetical protein
VLSRPAASVRIDAMTAIPSAPSLRPANSIASSELSSSHWASSISASSGRSSATPASRLSTPAGTA